MKYSNATEKQNHSFHNYYKTNNISNTGYSEKHNSFDIWYICNFIGYRNIWYM